MHENSFAHRDLKPGVSITSVLSKKFDALRDCFTRTFSSSQYHRRLGGLYSPTLALANERKLATGLQQ